METILSINRKHGRKENLIFFIHCTERSDRGRSGLFYK